MRTFDCLSLCVCVCVCAYARVSYSMFWCRRRRVTGFLLSVIRVRYHRGVIQNSPLKQKETKKKKLLHCVFVLPGTLGLRSGGTRSLEGTTIPGGNGRRPAITGPVLPS